MADVVGDGALTSRSGRRAGSRTRRNSGEQTRANLIEAARRIGARKPFSRITVEDLTSEANISRATFYLYFDNKTEIYLELVRETCEQLFEAAGHSWRADHPRDSVEIATRGYVKVFLANADVLRLLYTIANADDRFGSLLRETRERFVQRIERNLLRGQQSGLFRESLDAPLAARALGGMVETMCSTSVVEDGGINDIDRTVNTLTDLWYHAVAKES